MKNLLKKLHIMPNQSECPEGPSSSSSRSSRSNECPSPELSPSRSSPIRQTEQKTISSLSGWFNSVTTKHSNSPPSTSNVGREGMDSRDDLGPLDMGSSILGTDSESRSLQNTEMDEECQIQLALELSAKEDPEAVQIEAVKQISLGSCPPQNTPAELVAYRYWNYAALGYDDKILDGFYDLHGVLAESKSKKMPSLVDLQSIPVSDSISWEAVLVNRVADTDLSKLEQRALMMAVESKSGSIGFDDSDLVQKLAVLVACYMGGPVVDPDNMLLTWRDLSNRLRESLGNMVLPLGQLKIGLARHRALLFKVLADSVGVPCQLVKGQQYTGSDDVAMNIVKISDGREYIVDLMADPGTLIPSDTAGLQIEEYSFPVSSVLRDVDNSHGSSSSSFCLPSSTGGYSESRQQDKRSRSVNLANAESGLGDGSNLNDFTGHENPRSRFSSNESSSKVCKTEESNLSDDLEHLAKVEKAPTREISGKSSYPYAHARSPSWTEGVSSPAVHRMKVKDVSQYMIDAAKENPQLAQKLHDVLLESGVVAPRNLFTEIYTKHIGDPDEKNVRKDGPQHRGRPDIGADHLLPPLNHGVRLKTNPSSTRAENLKPPEGLGIHQPLYPEEMIVLPCSSQNEVSTTQVQGPSAGTRVKHMPAAAAAAATAAVVASSMVVAAAKSTTDSNLEVPVAAAATVTAAAVVATTAAVARQYEQLEAEGMGNEPGVGAQRQDGGVECRQEACVANPAGERILGRSTGNDNTKSDALDDASELEIPWEEITLGERIGLGSYGEVYRGEWHGTEVAVKKFLDQDISGDALAEFKSEVRIMKRVRHPNVVLFMGAVTRPPNLSIVTEFLPRGSLYRLIHRPNNQLDARRCLRMALDVARGMNYLHNSTPVIVHRDLKSPNLLVDKNWVVKVCDFGLSRMKHNTFLSSRSTAGTAEWMAPEVLRNELSDEKSDVFSFGVILWELATLQQPWGGMNPMQVVGAVGFQERRLDIPDDMDPVVADIIQKCWQTEPKRRPSFADIMAALKPLQKPSSQVPRPRLAIGSGSERVPSQCTQDPVGKLASANQIAEGTGES
eukprot:TRINITY_DN4829_c0_g1_i3.p1 TRINITY_DN4829_c0_g1~~TRINITY_DN4829_c0_g1_i3.p1  ORF type:complete len:1070 (-),score=263.44 TRINITY_DN4829_c0_g1_i3:1148-4357(-)